MELKIEHLSKQFKDKTAVNDVNLTLTPGVWGLLGASLRLFTIFPSIWKIVTSFRFLSQMLLFQVSSDGNVKYRIGIQYNKADQTKAPPARAVPDSVS